MDETGATTFVAMLGDKDTVAVERYGRTADHLTGVSVAAYPRATKRSYDLTFGADGAVQHLHLEAGAPGAAPASVVDFAYSGDSVVVTTRRDTTTTRAAVATEGARPLPFFEDLFAMWDVALGGVMNVAADSAALPTFAGRQVLPTWFARRGPGSVDFGLEGWGTGHATLVDGHLEGMDLTGTTSKYTVTKVPSANVDAIATAWAARPQPGILSPRDTARAQVGAAHVVVDYGRPSMRDRKVFGGIVPFGEVWRLGANAATQLITDRPLTIGGIAVPAGTYSLWCVPQADGWTLVINKQHGQWGTEYDGAQDLGRVPVTLSPVANPVEQFTIAVTDQGGGKGTLDMSWERTRGSVTFSAR
jgi:hypothetical protein